MSRVTPAVRCEDLSKRYPDGTLALAGVSLEIAPGTSLALVGGNGAGKSTLLHLVLGLLHPTAGAVTVLGQREPTRAHPRVGYLPESPRPEPGLDARGWLRHMARLAGLSDPRGAVERALDAVDLVEAAGRRLSRYSRGMLQRAALAQALLGEPELVLLDEPTSGLDPESQWRIRACVQERREAGVTVVLSSHNLAEVEALCDRVVVLRRGRVLADSSIAALRSAGRRVEIELAPGGGKAVGGLGLDRLGVTRRGDRLVLPEAAQAAVLAALLEEDVAIVALNPVRRTLEEAYLEVMR